jgi:hypothetical protein
MVTGRSLRLVGGCLSRTRRRTVFFPPAVFARCRVGSASVLFVFVFVFLYEQYTVAHSHFDLTRVKTL